MWGHDASFVKDLLIVSWLGPLTRQNKKEKKTIRLLSFIIVLFSIVEKVNRVKRQQLTLLYVNICWWLLRWYFIW